MKFLEKYWWVILLIILVGVGLYIWYSSKDAKTPDSKTPAPCTSLTPYAAAIQTMEDKIDATPDWKTAVTAQTTESASPCYNKTYQQCRKLNAIYQLKTEGVIPQGCPNS